MKKILIFAFVVFFVLTSCDYNTISTRKVHVSIPKHPWEDDDIQLWYTLKWNNGTKIESLYLDRYTKEVEIIIPNDCTVYICAYPLGEMLPYGCALVPTNRKKSVVLSQNEGFIAHLLINSDLDAATHVNFEELVNQIEEKTYDYRNIEDGTLVSDVINGCLKKDSIEIRNKIAVPSISIPDGEWISEWEGDFTLRVSDNETGVIELPPGVTRYYSKGLDREFRVVVESNGSVFHSLRYGMTGL